MNRRTFALLTAIALSGTLFTACEKDDTNTDTGPGPMVTPGQGLFVVNEGNFGWGNGSLGYYDTNKDTLYLNVFKDANGEYAGDVLQSLTILDDRAFMVVNNSQKIEVVHAGSVRRIDSINGFVSPRYILPVTGSKAYVSDLFGNHLRIIDMQNYVIKGEIPIPGWTEGLAFWRGKAYATGMQSSYVYQIDPATDEITDSLFLPPGPTAMTEDREGHLWVLAGSDPLFKTVPTLYQLHNDDFSIRNAYPLPDPDMMYSRLDICPQGETIYVLGGNVYQFRATDTEPQFDMLIPSEGRFLYALGVDPRNGDIYVSDPVDFVQEGIILRHDPTGQLISSHTAGINPGNFTFN